MNIKHLGALLLAVALLSLTGNLRAAIVVEPSGEIVIPVKRYALVIGVADYDHIPRLNNSVRDAELIADTLEKLEFEVSLVKDPSFELLRASLAGYARRLEAEDNPVSVVYYSGQGAEISGATYLVPRDADIDGALDLTTSTISVAKIMSIITTAAPDSKRIYFIDTSRDNPFASAENKFTPPIGDISNVGPNDLLAFSTSPGALALDGEDELGPFAPVLAKKMLEPNTEITLMLRQVRSDVLAATQGKQVPSETSALPGEFYFAIGDAAAAEEITKAEDPPETKAAKVLYRRGNGELASTYADGSFALLVGVGDYAQDRNGTQVWNDLKNVEDELTRLGSVLEKVHGFEVEEVFDPTGDELETVLETFVNLHGPKPNARLFIMMSGHGTTTERYGRKTAWFVPQDAPAIEPPAPFLNTALNLRRVEEWSEIMAAKHVLWVFDSCFSGAAIRMIESKSGNVPDGWAEHLHQNPVRRVLTAGSENEEVPAKSRFTETLIRVLSGQETVDGATDYITGQQLGVHLKQDIIRFNFKQGLPKNTPQSDTIVIPGEEGDVVFAIDPALSAKWMAESAK